MIRRYQCPACKKDVVSNDETFTIAHAVPECEWFTKACKEQGESRPPRLTVLDDLGREVKGGSA